MIKLENTNVYGWEAAIRGMRNPMNSWDRSDTHWPTEDYPIMEIGLNDLSLMRRLARAGSVDAKYRRMLTATVDITAPLYWWKEFDTYKVGTVANSCSTMHKIAEKEFSLEDFSHEHLMNSDDVTHTSYIGVLDFVVEEMNRARSAYLKTKDKAYWWQMIQLLPSSYNQRRTVQLNYEVLAGIYPKRKDHKLDEWHDFCDWIKSLPYSELITMEEDT